MYCVEFKNFADFGMSILSVWVDKRAYFTVSLVKKMSVSKDRACKIGVSPVSNFTHVYPYLFVNMTI